MSTYTVTIKDIVAWTVQVRATDSSAAENLAWELFQQTSDRSDIFAVDEDTTVTVEEVCA